MAIDYHKRGWRPGIRGHPVRKGEKYKVVTEVTNNKRANFLHSPLIGEIKTVVFVADNERNTGPYDIDFGTGWITDNQAVPLPKNNKLKEQKQ